MTEHMAQPSGLVDAKYKVKTTTLKRSSWSGIFLRAGER